MERGDFFSTGLYRSLKSFWQRRPYRRLDGSNRGKKRVRVARMGGRRRRIWRWRLMPRLKIKWVSPKKLLIKLRDAYVNMMLNLADSRVFSSEMVAGGYGAVKHPCVQPFGRMPLKEYDEKVILEFYRQLVIQEIQIPTLKWHPLLIDARQVGADLNRRRCAWEHWRKIKKSMSMGSSSG